MEIKIASVAFSYEDEVQNGVTVHYFFNDDESYSINGSGRLVLTNAEYDAEGELEDKVRDKFYERIGSMIE